MDEDDLPELTPPSPALSVRSDTSNRSTLARLRNMSLMGSGRTGHKKQFSLPPPTTEASIKRALKADSGEERGPGTRDSHLRQMSSFERLSNTLSNFVSTSSNVASPISSPSVLDSGDEDEDIDLERQARGRIRVRRISMPGSLPGNSDDERDEYEHGDEERGEESEEEDDYGYYAEHEEQTFDDDILATGEMENVPFL